ncbi:MAG: dipeptide epimerase [Planctomycetes bacterium]|nr:dipeptide epimerase [Planctomycetota bacterium]
MTIRRFEVRAVDVPLARPYAIAGERTEAVRMLFVELGDSSGHVGLGSATPEVSITGEDFESCKAALEGCRWLVGQDALDVHVLGKRIEERLPKNPGARAALDMALHDLWARQMEASLVDLLGRAHHELETSVTIGIESVEATLAQAREHVANGFRCLKIKTGEDLDLDVERLCVLRAELGPAIALRADANGGYGLHEVPTFFERTQALTIEFLEQPVKRAEFPGLRHLPMDMRVRIVADESVHDERDARELLRDPRPCAGWVVKLMKCGGIAPALRLAAIAREEGVALMWGCMDESRIGIAAALHAAFASSATRWLDLDGHMELARDLGTGGFTLERGRMRTNGEHGLGARLVAGRGTG